MGPNPRKAGQLRQGKNGTRSIAEALGVPVISAAPTNHVAAIAAAVTLTLAVNPSHGDTMTLDGIVYPFIQTAAAVKATGTLTMSVNPTSGDTLTIGSEVYTFGAGPGQIAIGGDAATTQTSLRASLLNHPSVDVGTWGSNAITITAKTAGVLGNAIGTTETFTSGSNVFAATTLLGGLEAVTITTELQIPIGVNLAATKVSVLAELEGHPTFAPAASWATNNLVMTYRSTGTGGNGKGATETFTSGSNVWTASTSSGGAATVPGYTAPIGTTVRYGDNLYHTDDGLTWAYVALTPL